MRQIDGRHLPQRQRSYAAKGVAAAVGKGRLMG